LSFAVMPVFAKLEYRSGVEPLGLLSWRFVIAALALWAVVAVRRRRTADGAVLPPRRRALGTVALGGLLLAGEVVLYFFGLRLIGAGLAEVLLFLFPAWVVVLTSIRTRVRPSTLVIVCTLIAVAGAGLCIGGSIGAAGGAESVAGVRSSLLAGAALAVGASISYAFYVVLADARVAADGPLATTTLVITGAAVSLTLAAALTQSRGPHTRTEVLLAVGIALVSTVAAFGLLSAGLALLPVSHAAVIATSEPVLAVILGAVLLGEAVGVWQAVGIVLVVLAIRTILWRDGKAL